MDAGTHGLGKRFLGGKALGQVVSGLRVRAKALVFVFDQHALGEAVAEARQRAFDAADIDRAVDLLDQVLATVEAEVPV